MQHQLQIPPALPMNIYVWSLSGKIQLPLNFMAVDWTRNVFGNVVTISIYMFYCTIINYNLYRARV